MQTTPTYEAPAPAAMNMSENMTGTPLAPSLATPCAVTESGSISKPMSLRTLPKRENITFHPYKRLECNHADIKRKGLVGPAGSGSTTPCSQSDNGETPAITPPFQTVIEPDRDFISRFYDEDSSGMRTLGAKFWLASDRSKSKTVVSVPGEGNCFWEALQRAGIPVNVPSRRKPVYTDYKQATLEYYRSDDCRKLLSNLSPNDIRLQALLSLDSEAALEEAAVRLTSEGAFATEPVFQLAALALKVDITIEDIARPGYQLGFYSGTENGSKAPEQILLLLRNHGLHPVFDKNFFPVTDGTSKIVKSSGHFWLVVNQTQSSPLPAHTESQGNEQRSELDRP